MKIVNLLAMSSDTASTLGILGLFVAAMVVMIVLNGGRRKKMQAEYSGMLDSLRVGTKVKTVGGVIGVIKEIREEAPGFRTVLLETGVSPNCSYVLYDLQAVYGIVDTEKLAAATIAKDAPAITGGDARGVEDHQQADNGIGGADDVSETLKPKSKGKKR